MFFVRDISKYIYLMWWYKYIILQFLFISANMVGVKIINDEKCD